MLLFSCILLHSSQTHARVCGCVCVYAHTHTNGSMLNVLPFVLVFNHITWRFSPHFLKQFLNSHLYGGGIIYITISLSCISGNAAMSNLIHTHTHTYLISHMQINCDID